MTFATSHSDIGSVSCLGYLTDRCCLFPGNTKKAIYILQKAFELGAEPKEMLERTLQSMQAGKINLSCFEDKENVPCEFVCLF